jgi:hypothetical protein
MARPGLSSLFGAVDLPSENECDKNDWDQDRGAGEEWPSDAD